MSDKAPTRANDPGYPYSLKTTEEIIAERFQRIEHRLKDLELLTDLPALREGVHRLAGELAALREVMPDDIRDRLAAAEKAISDLMVWRRS